MPVELRLPDLGDGVEDADVIAILVSPGDTVAVDQGLLEIETDKASVEVPAERAGRIVEFRVSVGDTIRPGDVFATLDAGTDPDGASADGASTDDAGAPRSAAAEGTADDAGSAAETAPVEASDGDARGAEPPAAASGESAAAESAAGSDSEADAGSAAESDAGSDFGSDADSDAGSDADADDRDDRPGVAAAPPLAAAEGGEPVAAAPSVRAFARQIGVDIRQVPGSGPGGRIGTADVQRYARERAAGAAGGAAPAAQPLPDLAQWGPVERERMSRTRRATMRTLARSWQQSPHVTIQHLADVTELEEQRRALREEVAARGGGKLTLLPILVKVAAELLHQHPRLNAAIDAEALEIVYRRSMHIGIAVDTPRGLLVPVVRDADRKTITEISGEMAALGERARDGDLRPEEMEGATFTLTNLGGFGTGFFTPILNPPQVAILGVGRAREEAAFVDRQVVAVLRLPLSLSFDHRLVDGADAARFMQAFTRALEDPLRIVL